MKRSFLQAAILGAWTLYGFTAMASPTELLGKKYTCTGTAKSYVITFDERLESGPGWQNYLATVTSSDLPSQQAEFRLAPFATSCAGGWDLSASLEGDISFLIHEVSFDACGFPGDSSRASMRLKGQRQELSCSLGWR